MPDQAYNPANRKEPAAEPTSMTDQQIHARLPSTAVDNQTAATYPSTAHAPVNNTRTQAYHVHGLLPKIAASPTRNR